MSDYDYDVVPDIEGEGLIEKVILGQENDEGYRRLRLKVKYNLNEPETEIIEASAGRLHFDRFTRPKDGNSDLTENKQTALSIAKRQFTDLQISTGVLKVEKDAKGRAVVRDGKVNITGTPLTADTISRLEGRYLKFKMGPQGLDPSQYEFKWFKAPTNGHQNPTDDTPF